MRRMSKPLLSQWWSPLPGLFLASVASAQPVPPAAKPPTAAVPAKPAWTKPAAPPAAKGLTAAPVAGEPFTLAQATVGLPPTGGLVASIEFEQSGKSLGTVRCELFADKTPLAVANFVGLARGLRPFREPQGSASDWYRRPFYDKGQIHRVIPDFMIQGGDPFCASSPTCNGRPGAGDPGYAIPDELREELRFDRGGRLAMATRNGKDSAGSQFFITERETPWLNGSQTIFGQCEPVEVIRAVSHVETQNAEQPKVAVQIKRVVITRQAAASAPSKTPVTK